jgi:hypothetical protein
MKAADVWTLLLGAVVALAGTLLAQWSSLAYQTGRQREARRADFQRTTLLDLRTVLSEVQETVGRAMAIRRQLAEEHELSGQDPDEWAATLIASHPDRDELRRLDHRLMIVTIAVDDEQLRTDIDMLRELVFAAPLTASNKQAQAALSRAFVVETKVLKRLGEQLRRLP